MYVWQSIAYAAILHPYHPFCKKKCVYIELITRSCVINLLQINRVFIGHHCAEETSREQKHKNEDSCSSFLSPLVQGNEKDGRDNVQLHVDAQVPAMTNTLERRVELDHSLVTFKI